MKNKLIASFVVVILVLVGASFFLNSEQSGEVVMNEDMTSIEDAKDAKGEKELSDEQAIKLLLDSKFEIDPEETTIDVEENTGEYARGGYGASDPQGGGGMWFAAKVDGEWKLVYDGNGSVFCSQLEDYPDYPTEFIPECWDEESGKMISRQ